MTSTHPARTARPHGWFLLAAPIAALLTPSPAFALWEVAEGEVFLTAEVAVTSDSNIALNNQEISDTIYAIEPGVTFERSGGRASLQLDFSTLIERYDTYDAQDSESYNAGFSLDLPSSPGGRLAGNLTAGYFDGYQVDSYLNDRIGTRSFNVGLDSSYDITNRINGRLGGRYDKSDPDNSPEYRNSSLTAGLGYDFREALSAFVDFRFSDSQSGFSESIGGRTSNSSTAIIVGLDGEITAKLRGRLGVGYQNAEIETAGVSDEEDGPTVDISLTWQPRQRTTVTITASHDFRVTSLAETADYATYNITLAQSIGQRLSANLGLSYETTDFTSGNTRTDDVLTGTAGLTYSIGDHYNIGITYDYTDSDSNTVISDYSRSVFRLFANARF